MRRGCYSATMTAVFCLHRPTSQSAHDGAVTGLAVAAANTSMVSIGLDASLRIWDFKYQKLKQELKLAGPASLLAHHSGTDLVAVACDDLVLYMCAHAG